jgi:hypothetical protein
MTTARLPHRPRVHGARAFALAVVLLAAAGCDSTRGQITVWTRAGDAITGIVERSDATTLVVRDAAGARHEIRRADVAAMAAVGAGGSIPAPTLSRPAPVAARRTIAVPAGTPLSVTLGAAVASATARTGDGIEAALAAPLVAEGVTLAPAGSRLFGAVTGARPAGAEGTPARLALRFDRLQIGTGSVAIDAAVIERRGRVVQRGNRVVGALGSIVGRRPKTTAVDFALAAGTPLDVALASPLIVEVAATP